MAHKNSAQSIVALTIIYLVLNPILVTRDNSLIKTGGERGDSQAFIASTTGPQPVYRTYNGMLAQNTDAPGPVSDMNHQDDQDALEQWIIEDENSTWHADELEMVGKAISDTFNALATIGLDSREILDGYKIRRYDGEYVRDERGLVALVNHGQMEIVLPDAAFKRLNGFSIYHEIGHVLDNQLDRKLTIEFHKEAQDRVGFTDTQSQTAYGYWMRPLAREGREEATADAFALWVTVDHAGMKRPIFAGMPLDVQYDGITQVIEQALILSNTID
ncbi:MAG: hypothetical protein WA996_00820 [Candidatus Promineifilaceae bacterium]